MMKSYFKEEQILGFLKEDQEMSCLSDKDINTDVFNKRTNKIASMTPASLCENDEEGEPCLLYTSRCV